MRKIIYSNEIKKISVISIILVLYIHSSHSSTNLIGYNVLYWIQQIFSYYIGRIAVPTFFMISGFLFYNKIKNKGIKTKLKSRISTLIIPYIIACTIYVIIMLTLSFITPEIINTSYIYRELLHKSVIEIVYEIFINANANKPLAFHLWFLRNLIIAVYSTYFINSIPDKIKAVCFIILFIYGCTQSTTSLSFSLFYFYLGGLICTKFQNTNITKATAIISFFIYTILSVYEALTKDSFIWKHLQIPIIFIGIIAFIYSCKKYTTIIDNIIFKISSYTFFIYLAHEPLINIVRKGAILLLGDNEIIYIVSYLFTPLITIFILIYIAKLCRLFIPYIYNIYVGKRI